jgi:hypothetical protein
MSNKHAWSKALDVTYQINSPNHRICGKEDVPTRASKFQEK